MSRYTQRVCDSILPLSVGDTLLKASEEWYFTEEVVDHEQPSDSLIFERVKLPSTTPAPQAVASKGCVGDSDGQNAQLRGYWAR
jgi:hypothetical protein